MYIKAAAFYRETHFLPITGLQYQPSALGALDHRLRSGDFWHSRQLSLNKFFDPSTPSMRESHDGEKMGKKWRKKNNGVASRPPEHQPTETLTSHVKRKHPQSSVTLSKSNYHYSIFSGSGI